MEEQKVEKTISLKRGRPTKYTKETARSVIGYIKKCAQDNNFPTIEHLASVFGVADRSRTGDLLFHKQPL